MNLCRKKKDRRGVALLLALMALVLLSSAAVPLLRTSQRVSVTRHDTGESIASRSIAESLQPLLIDWSREHAAEPQAPFFELIHQSEYGGRFISVRAIDLSGRLQVSELDTFTASGIPQVVLDSVRDIEQAEPRTPRESELPQRLIDEYVADDPRAVLFPSGFTDRHAPSSIIEWISAHGDPKSNGQRELNVNGAPVALLRAALRGRDPTLAARAIELRQQGLLVPEMLVASLNGNEDESIKRVPLRSTSIAFGFLVSIDRGSRNESYWFVVETRAGGWVCTERRRIARGGER